MKRIPCEQLSVDVLHGVGPKLKERLRVLGLKTLHDLLWYMPRVQKDRTAITAIVDVATGTPVTVRATVDKIAVRRAWKRRRMAIVDALVSDDTGSLAVVWFNQPYLVETLKTGDEVLLTGVVKATKYGRSLQSPEYEKIYAGKAPVHAGRIVPEYPLTAGVTQKQMRYVVKQALERCVPNDVVVGTASTGVVSRNIDWLPNEVVRKAKCLGLNDALRYLHFPDSFEQFERARERLYFDELLLIQLYTQLLKSENEHQPAPVLMATPRVQTFIEQLPFALTSAQQRSLNEILSDLALPRPMNRLLVGDVGSGKTVVAAAAMVTAVSAGYQAALLVPTEILALQHSETLRRHLTPLGISVALLTAHTQKRATRSQLPDDALPLQGAHPDITVGTHALIQEHVRFHRLGLVIIDEQHRFGVEQRKTLRERSGLKGATPHLLSMSATPIPRTLALTIYSDLALSVIDELPAGRQTIKTYVVPPHKRQGAYGFIREHVQQGEQCFVLCPLIEPSDTLGVRSVTAEYERLTTEIFPDLRVAMLHGKMKSEEKRDLMERMRQQQIDVLVATSVIEVGVDIPHATIMMIEGAERFGLAQLHQFRGRVGRSNKQSFCLLFTDSGSATAQEGASTQHSVLTQESATTQHTLENKRLKAMTTTNDGFALAELDLKLRGAGELYGVAQTGFSSAALIAYQYPHLVERARTAAQQIITQRLASSHPAVQERLNAFLQRVHVE